MLDSDIFPGFFSIATSELELVIIELLFKDADEFSFSIFFIDFSFVFEDMTIFYQLV